MSPDTSRLTRRIIPMARDIRAALKSRGLEAAYDHRPAYQRNDYLGWIERARRPATRSKRLGQMLDSRPAGSTWA